VLVLNIALLITIIWIVKKVGKGLSRTDFIDYHPTDDVKKDKEQNPPVK